MTRDQVLKLRPGDTVQVKVDLGCVARATLVTVDWRHAALYVDLGQRQLWVPFSNVCAA